MGDVQATDARATVVDIGDGLKLEADGRVMKADKTLATESDVAVRDDLSRDHPLYGSRAVRCVPCGMPDCTIVDGRLVPIEPAKPVEPEPKPIDDGDGEVTRVG
jgi:hypothetical protein